MSDDVSSACDPRQFHLHYDIRAAAAPRHSPWQAVPIGPVLFLLIFVAATAFVALRRRAKRTVQENQHRTVLNALAPLVSGAVSKDEVLTGRYGEYAVTTEMGIGSPPGVTSGHAGSGANVLRVHIASPSLMTGQAWHFRNTRDATHLGGHWRFIEPGAEFPFGRMLSRAADIPMPDPRLEDGLRARGIEAAFDRLPPSSAGWLPEVAFAGGMGRSMLERYERAGRTLPPEAQEKVAAVGGLRIEVERQHFDDPSPDQFRQLLDAAVDIIEINRQANP